MSARSVVRWVFAGLSAVAAGVLITNIDNLVEARGWDKLLTQAVGDELPLLQYITSPLAAMLAVAVLTFTAGLWADAVLARLQQRTPSKQDRLHLLGAEGVGLAHAINECIQISSPESNIPLIAKVNSLLLRFEKAGFAVAQSGPAAVVTPGQQLIWARHYLIHVGQLLKDGLVQEARVAAKHISAEFK